MKRYGICNNVGVCSKVGNIQCIDDENADFICSECEEPLAECDGDKESEVKRDPEKDKKKRKMLTLVSAVILIGAFAGIYLVLNGEPKPLPEPPGGEGSDTTIVDLPTPEPAIESALAALAAGHVEEENGTGSISTPYGKYKGDLKEGKANGNGTFQFFKACRISSKDNQQRMAEAGDYISGQFSDNEITQVKWFAKDGTQKGVIIIGKSGV